MGHHVAVVCDGARCAIFVNVFTKPHVHKELAQNMDNLESDVYNRHSAHFC
jgi:hypothetical protein